MTAFRLLESRAQSAPLNAAFDEWLLPDGAQVASFHRVDGGYLIRFPGLADFEVSCDSRSIACHPAPFADEEMCWNLYFNQVLPLAMSKRGHLVFHASAVNLSGTVVAFMGRSGSGKSTLAAAFAKAGHRFLGDDALVLEEEGDGYRALPSRPSIRLWNDSENALIGGAAIESPADRPAVKKRVPAGGGIAYCLEPCPLSCVYFLGGGAETLARFERLDASQALIESVRNSFLLDPRGNLLLASHFDRVARFAAAVPCFRLDYPRRFDKLSEIQSRIAQHHREVR